MKLVIGYSAVSLKTNVLCVLNSLFNRGRMYWTFSWSLVLHLFIHYLLSEKEIIKSFSKNRVIRTDTKRTETRG